MDIIMTAPRLAAQAVALIEAAGGQLHYMAPYPTAPEVAQLAARVNPVAILSRQGPVDGTVMDAAPRLRIIARHGVGVDDVDIAEAVRRGVIVTRAPGSNTRAVSEHAMAMILALVKDLSPLTAQVANGGWRDAGTKVGDIAGLRLGLVGCGAVGQAVARLAAAFGMEVVGYDPLAGEVTGIERIHGLEALWPRSDVLSLHVPYGPETRHLVDGAALAALPAGAYVVNTARGGIIDEAALWAALESGHVAGAGLDVFEMEPPGSDDRLRGAPQGHCHPACGGGNGGKPSGNGGNGRGVHRGCAERAGGAGGATGRGLNGIRRMMFEWVFMRPWIAAFLAGLVSALALPPLHVIPSLFLAVPIMLLLVGRTSGVRGALALGFWFGFGHHLIGLYWITEAILLESARYWWLVPLAVPALSALLALFIAAAFGTARLAPDGWHRVVTLAGAWVLADLARQFIGTGFPWNPWGSVWAIPGVVGDVMIQPAAWVGTPGLTLFTVLLAGLPRLGRRGWGAAAAMLLVWAGAGALRVHERAPPGQGLTAVLVQGNVQQGMKWDRSAAEAAFERELRLSAEGVAAAPGPSVVIWPETSSFYYLQSDPGARQAIAAATEPALGAIVGSLTFTKGVPSAEPGNEPFNTMVALNTDASIAGLYDKWHLVPFGEYPPSWVPFAIQIVPGHFGFGRGPATLRMPGVPPFGGMICYEVIFPGQVVDEADRPDWLVNITNDAWFGNSTGPRQHLAAARLRAVEEGLPLMRAANTGITAGFDAWGREQGRLEMGTAGVLGLALPGKQAPTLFSVYGLYLPGALALLALAVGARPSSKRLIRS